MPVNISSSILFNLNTKQFTYTDNTNYSSFGISAADVVGIIRGNGPSGVFYNNTNFNTPNIDPDNNTSVTLALPTTNGEVTQGVYTFLYRIRVTSIDTLTSISNGFTTTGDRTGSYTPGKQFTVSSGPNAGTYTVLHSSYLGNITTIIVAEAIANPNSVVSEATVYDIYEKEDTYNFCYSRPKIEIDLEANCDTATLTSRDLTNYSVNFCNSYIYPTSVSRVHTIKAPYLNGSPVIQDTVSQLANVVIAQLYTQTWTSIVQSTVTWTLTSGLVVTDIIIGSNTIDVSCDDRLCCVFSCLQNIYRKWAELKGTNPTRAAEYYQKFFDAMANWMLYSIAKSCGNTQAANNHLQAIIDIATAYDCHCCPEDTNQPQRVIPLGANAQITGSGANISVTSCGNGINVTQSIVGNSVEFALCLDTTIIEGYIHDYIQNNPDVIESIIENYFEDNQFYVPSLYMTVTTDIETTIQAQKIVCIRGDDPVNELPVVGLVWNNNQYPIGISISQFGGGSNGLVLVRGRLVTSLNTTSANIGDPVYCKLGNLTLEKETGQLVGVVESISTNGVVYFDFSIGNVSRYGRDVYAQTATTNTSSGSGEQPIFSSLIEKELLADDGDGIEVDFFIHKTNSNTDNQVIGVKLNSIKLFESPPLNSNSDVGVLCNAKIVRTSPTSVRTLWTMKILQLFTISPPRLKTVVEVVSYSDNTGMNNFNTLNNNLQVYVNTAGGPQFTLRYASVKPLKQF